MMIAEAEAKEAWCPEVRVHATATSAVGINAYTKLVESKANKSDDVYEVRRLGNCIGSECMMWRWGANETGVGRPKRGYCGRAGKP